jgi:hypothetical protein
VSSDEIKCIDTCLPSREIIRADTCQMSARETVEESNSQQSVSMGMSESAVEFVRDVIKEAKQRNDEISALKDSVMVLRYQKEALAVKITSDMTARNEKAMDELRRMKDSERETALLVAQVAHDAAMKAKDETHMKQLRAAEKKLATMQSLSDMVKRVICVNDLDHSVECLAEKVVRRMIVENGSFVDCPVDPVERMAYFERSVDEQAGTIICILKDMEKQRIDNQRQMEQMSLDSASLAKQKKFKTHDFNHKK